MRRLGQIRTLSDGLLVAQILIIAVLTPALMRLPLKHVHAFLEPNGPLPEPNDASERRVLAALRVVLDSGRRLLRPTCLTRGVTRYYALRRAGVDVALVFGIRQDTGDHVDGHCWLVRNGEPFLETQDPHGLFIEMYRIAGRSTSRAIVSC